MTTTKNTRPSRISFWTTAEDHANTCGSRDTVLVLERDENGSFTVTRCNHCARRYHTPEGGIFN